MLSYIQMANCIADLSPESGRQKAHPQVAMCCSTKATMSGSLTLMMRFEHRCPLAYIAKCIVALDCDEIG